MKYITVENGKILAVADWQFPGSVLAEKPVVRGWDGALYFEGEEPQQPEPTINELRAAKIQSINDTYEQQARLVRVDVPENEVLTWDIQKLEAEAWQINPEVTTPFINALAEARQIDRAILLEKVLEKVTAYRNYIGGLTGTRQRLEDLVNAATTKEELEAIVWPSTAT